ncbi:MAG: hypothetical protein Q7V20_11125 [Aquabacterium sp.]|uniref:hypothetical protein n=1 Tax=Aquabacterium sp. TaxID=1872578 RepID=UPI00271A2122|nr:hypothetical protein [Aquabacterium sp.]MDO9003995.1 hypothetical protein [Aquabacterium sp.]
MLVETGREEILEEEELEEEEEKEEKTGKFCFVVELGDKTVLEEDKFDIAGLTEKA